MTNADLRVAIKAVLDQVPCEQPDTWQYCSAVRDALLATIAGSAVECFHRNIELVVNVRTVDAQYHLVVPLV